MKKKKDLPKPLVALENLTHNYPDIWERVDPSDFSSAQKFCDDNGIPESKYIIAALAKWRLSKQIFEIDEELCDILMETDKLDEELPNEVVNRLIYDCFYVTLPDGYINIKSIKNASGEYNDLKDMTIDGFFYQIIGKSIIIVIMFSSGHTQSLGFDVKEDLSLQEMIESHMTANSDVYKIINFFVQIVLYLSADNADIEENKVQKEIYKPPVRHKVKDSFSELRKWDVGFRYGKAIKKARQIEKKNQSVSSEHHEGSHARKRTHVRKGHYHHFWRGSKQTGDRELILKWISPVVINAEFENVATIRKVKK